MRFSQNIRDALMGCLEMPLFLKAGIGRFSGSKDAMRSSFLVAFLLLLPAAWLAQANPDFKDYPYALILFKFTLEFIIFSFLYLPCIYFITKELGRGEFFPAFVNGSNWLNISQIAMLTPLVLGVMAGHWQWTEIFYFLVFLLMYGYAYMAFFITYIFRINWMLGTGLSILGMAIGELAHYFVYGPAP